MTTTTIAPAAPPGRPDGMPATTEDAEHAFLDRLHALEVTAVRLAAERDQARKDVAAVVHQNLALSRLANTQDEENRALRGANEALRTAGEDKDAAIIRHERAAQAHAAIEAAKGLRPTTRALLFAALSGALLTVGLAAAVTGFVMNQGPVILAGSAATGIALAMLAAVCNSPAPHRPFDLDDGAAGRD